MACAKWKLLIYLFSALHSGASILFPQDVGLPNSLNAVLLPNERNSLDDCPLRYYKYGLDSLASSAAASPYYDKEFAHIVKIGVKEANETEWLCSGALLSEKYVLATADCVNNGTSKPNTVLFADNKTAQIESMSSHPEYQADKNGINLAIIQLSGIANISEIVLPACLWSQANFDFESVELVHFDKVQDKMITNDINYTRQSCEDTDNTNNFCLLQNEINVESNSSVVVQKLLMASSHMVPFIVGLMSTNSGDPNEAEFAKVSTAIKWIEDNVGIPMDPKKCGQRHLDKRIFEPDVIGMDSKNKVDLDFVSVIYGKAHISLSYGRLKHVASIGWSLPNGAATIYNCTGSLFHENYILTSAKCATLNEKSPDIVRLGEFVSYYPEPDEKNVTYKIKKVFVHPDYKPDSHYHDIALIQVEENMAIQYNVKPACLWTNYSTPVEELEYYGFGPQGLNTFWSGEQPEDDEKLLNIHNNYISEKTCNNYFNNFTGLDKGVTDNLMCMKNDLNIVPGSCELAVGGSLVREIYTYQKFFPFVFGVESFGKDCGFGYPAVSTRVSHYINWIESIVFDKLNEYSPSKDNDAVYFDNSSVRLGDPCFILDTAENGTCQSLRSCELANGKMDEGYDLCFFDREPIVCCPKDSSEPRTNNKTITERNAKCFNSHQEFRIKNDANYTDWKGANYNYYRYYEKRLPLAGEFPHAAIIGVKDEWFCPGALISEKHILTSANCIAKLNNTDIRVRVGSTNATHSIASEDEDNVVQEYGISSVVNHPNYNGSALYDIAILVLSDNVNITQYVVPACLWNNETHNPFALSTLGLAKSDNETCLEIDPRIPMYNSDCRRTYKELESYELCADARRSKSDTCFDKSGDLLQAVYLEDNVHIPFIVGIFSNSINCTENNPSIFTKITFYSDWIYSILN